MARKPKPARAAAPKPLNLREIAAERRIAAAGRAAGAAALQTPPVVRRAFLQRDITLGGLRLKPLTVLGLWILEDIGSPFVCESTLGDDGQPVRIPIQFADIARALFVMCDEEYAEAAWLEGKADFDKGARAFGSQVPASDFGAAVDAINSSIAAAQAPAPGTSPEIRPASDAADAADPKKKP